MTTTTTEKGAGGRPEFAPTSEQMMWVLQAAKIGLSQEIIRLNVINPETDLPVSLKTLRKHFGRALDTGLALWGESIVTVASTVAKDKDHKDYARMAIFLMQSRLGMKAVTVNEMTGLDGEPLAVPGLIIVEGSHDSQAGPE